MPSPSRAHKEPVILEGFSKGLFYKLIICRRLLFFRRSIRALPLPALLPISQYSNTFYFESPNR
jgi:hypothetical protein